MRGVAKMYDLVQPAMDAWAPARGRDGPRQRGPDRHVCGRLELQLHSGRRAGRARPRGGRGPGAWAVIQRRVLGAGVGWFKERLLDTVLAYLWPRMDENVSTSLGHLTKAACRTPRRGAWRGARPGHLRQPVGAGERAEAGRVGAAMDAAVQNLVAATQKPPVVDVEDAVPPRPRPPPRRLGLSASSLR